MNVRIIGMVCGFVWAVPAFAAEIGLEFSGVLGTGKELQVALTKKPQSTTQWVAVGGKFEGYVVSSYDAKTDVLVLTKEGQQLRLPLKEGKTRSGAATKLSDMASRAIFNNLRQLAAAADQYYLENGKTSATYDDLVGPTKYVKQLNAVDGENYRALQFVQGKPLTVTTASGVPITLRP